MLKNLLTIRRVEVLEASIIFHSSYIGRQSTPDYPVPD